MNKFKGLPVRSYQLRENTNTKLSKIVIPTIFASILAVSTLFTAGSAVSADGETHKVHPGDTLYSLANQYNTSIEDLKIMNDLDSNLIRVGQSLQLNEVSTSRQSEEQVQSEPSDLNEYIVKTGDTVYSIATKHEVTVRQLQTENNLNSSLIITGQTLAIPGEDSAPREEQQDESTSHETGNDYTVQQGDTLWSIAQKFNTSVKDIQEINGLTGTTIFIDQHLIVGVSETITTEAIVQGAVDNLSVEFMVNGEPLVIELNNSEEAGEFQEMAGKKLKITYENTGRPTLISYEKAE